MVDRQLRWTGGFGLADAENAVPATAETMYRLASVSKTMTATAAMQLAERGRLDLDAPIRRYVPGFPEKPWPITTRQLLGHLGGIRHYLPNEEFDATRQYVGVLEGLDVFKDDPLVHEPGTAYLYSTYGFDLVGAVVEAASGARFLDYLRENVFRPAGMESIRDDDARVLIPHRAQGYVRLVNGELRNAAPADTSYKIPGGGLIATAADVVRFAAALENGALVKPETRTEMWTRQKTRSGQVAGLRPRLGYRGMEGPARDLPHGRSGACQHRALSPARARPRRGRPDEPPRSPTDRPRSHAGRDRIAVGPLRPVPSRPDRRCAPRAFP